MLPILKERKSVLKLGTNPVTADLLDTFRLLNRFGARLRARHGPGTKRHIKFDDYSGSLYANVKLPGDATWTRVSLDMASSDLEASVREEDAKNRKRFAQKLLPGSRERLAIPMALHQAPDLWNVLAPVGPRSGASVSAATSSGRRPVTTEGDRTTPADPAGGSQRVEAGPRPRWKPPANTKAV